MTLIDIFQVSAVALSLSSMILAAKQSVWSPILGAMSLVPWMCLAWATNLHYLNAYNLVVLVLNIRTFIHWKYKIGKTT